MELNLAVCKLAVARSIRRAVRRVAVQEGWSNPAGVARESPALRRTAVPPERDHAVSVRDGNPPGVLHRTDGCSPHGCPTTRGPRREPDESASSCRVVRVVQDEAHLVRRGRARRLVDVDRGALAARPRLRLDPDAVAVGDAGLALVLDVQPVVVRAGTAPDVRAVDVEGPNAGEGVAAARSRLEVQSHARGGD